MGKGRVAHADTTRILVVEEEDGNVGAMLLRSGGLDAVLDRMSSLDQALASCGARSPDLIVVDLARFGVGAVATLRRRASQLERVPVLAVAQTADPLAEAYALEFGADDCVPRTVRIEVLLARVRALLRRFGGAAVPLRFGDLRMDVQARTLHRGERLIHLTHTEFELLRLLLERPGEVVSKSRLYEAVWGPHLSGANVVEVAVSRIRAKLAGTGEPQLIRTVRKTGYVLRPPER